MEKPQVMKTGTTTIGIMCKDGVLLAADKRATMGSFIADKKSEKIYKIDDTLALTTAGTVSDIQLLTKLIKAELKLKQIRTGRKPSVKEAANLLSGMIYSNIRKYSVIPGLSHFILGGVDDSGYHIYDLFVDGSLTEVDDYVSSGSGSVMAYGVLETLYKQGLTLKDGVPLAVKSLNAALQRDSGSGNGVDVVTITKEGYSKVFHKEIDTTVSA
jgi:proteasome beta subunit